MRDVLWITLTIIGWGCWSVVQKLALRHTSPAMVQLINAYVYSTFAPIIYLVMKAKNAPFVWNTWGIVWTTVAASLATLASFAFLFAIQDKPVYQVLSYAELHPILSFILCWVLLGEAFTLQRALGAIMIVAGCIIMNR